MGKIDPRKYCSVPSFEGASGDALQSTINLHSLPDSVPIPVLKVIVSLGH